MRTKDVINFYFMKTINNKIFFTGENKLNKEFFFLHNVDCFSNFILFCQVHLLGFVQTLLEHTKITGVHYSNSVCPGRHNLAFLRRKSIDRAIKFRQVPF